MAVDLTNLQTTRYEVVNPGENGIAVVTLNRPESRNAQNKRMTYELEACFTDASRRSDVKVIVFQADGPHFCSGHDMRDTESHKEFNLVFPVGGFGREGQEGHMAWEEEVYFNMCWRWRNLPKPVIAAAQGKTIAGGLMLLWIADVIIASEDAMISDPVVAMGVNTSPTHGKLARARPRRCSSRANGSLPTMLTSGAWSTGWYPPTSCARRPWQWRRPLPNVHHLRSSWPRKVSTRLSRRRDSGTHFAPRSCTSTWLIRTTA